MKSIDLTDFWALQFPVIFELLELKVQKLKNLGKHGRSPHCNGSSVYVVFGSKLILCKQQLQAPHNNILVSFSFI